MRQSFKIDGVSTDYGLFLGTRGYKRLVAERLFVVLFCSSQLGIWTGCARDAAPTTNNDGESTDESNDDANNTDASGDEEAVDESVSDTGVTALESSTGTGDLTAFSGLVGDVDASIRLSDGGSDSIKDTSTKNNEIWHPASCSMPEQGLAPTPTEEAFIELLIGRWLLCDAISVFGTSDEVGIEFSSDGRFYKLYANEDGTTSRGTGFDNMGSWEAIDTSSMNGPGVFQLNLNVDGGLSIMTFPAFATEPRKMRLNNADSMSEVNYAIETGERGVRPSDAGSDSTEDASTRDDEKWRPASCSLPEQGLAPTPTEEAFIELLVGRWLLCDAVSVFGTSDEVGIEFSSDGRWYKLYDNEDGTTSRGVGFDKMGSWEAIDTSVMNGPGVFQLNLNIDGGFTIITRAAFATEPRKMRLSNYNSFTSEGVLAADYAIDS